MSTTQEKLNILLDSLIEVTTKTTDMASEQVPLVLQEIVKWGMVKGLFFIALGLIFFAFLIYGCLCVWNKKEDSSFIEDMAAICTPVYFFLWIGFFSNGAYKCLKVYFAPKLYLLNYLKGML